MEWYKQPLKMQKYILTVLVHQKPVTLSVGCFMPELNLRFYCSVRQINISNVNHDREWIIDICVLSFVLTVYIFTHFRAFLLVAYLHTSDISV